MKDKVHTVHERQSEKNPFFQSKILLFLFQYEYIFLHRWLQTRNVSMGHGSPRYCQIRINRELSLTKGNNS